MAALEHPLAELLDRAPAETLALGQAAAPAAALAAVRAGAKRLALAGTPAQARVARTEVVGRQVAYPPTADPLADVVTLAARPFRWASSWRALD